MSPSCRPTAAGIDLFAWLTLASSDETSFADADTQAVAGRLNRERARAAAARGRPAQPALLAAGDDQRHPAASSSSACRRRRRLASATATDVVVTGTPDAPAPISNRRPGHRDHRPAGGSGRPQALPDPRAGHRRRPQPEAGRVADPAARCGSTSSTGSASTSAAMPASRRQAPLAAGHPQPRAARGSACRCPAGGCCLVRATGRTGRSCSAKATVADRAVGEDVEIAFGAVAGVVRTEVRTRPDQGGLVATSSSSSPTPSRAGPLRGRVRGRARRSFQASAARARRLRVWAATIPANGGRRADGRAGRRASRDARLRCQRLPPRRCSARQPATVSIGGVPIFVLMFSS